MSLCPECSHYKSVIEHAREDADRWKEKYEEAVEHVKDLENRLKISKSRSNY